MLGDNVLLLMNGWVAWLGEVLRWSPWQARREAWQPRLAQALEWQVPY